MFDNQPPIIASGPSSYQPEPPFHDSGSGSKFKRYALIGLFALASIAFVFGTILAVRSLIQNRIAARENNQNSSTTPPAVLPPNIALPETVETKATSSDFEELKDVEYLSFASFYQRNSDNPKISAAAYSLPLNAKIDVMNYYDVSRKINIDSSLQAINDNGYAIIENPFSAKTNDFFGIYEQLDGRQVPLLITADSLIYYQQNAWKKAFKEIEENVFYENLWSINKELYDTAKNRYESRLAKIGSVNDASLEGERLEVAFFAIALELLKPSPEQIVNRGQNEGGGFTTNDADRFYFVTPPYLKEDVMREVALIRAGREKTKSPVMLYTRDYGAEFNVPEDYKNSPKLHNFYLANRWLNTLFPLYYKDQNCASCFLDKEDWRLNLIAASLISKDFADSPALKNRWARIYKVMAFFTGLREDLTYVEYRDTMISLFGADYDPEDVFADDNPQAKANLDKFRDKLSKISFSSLQGAVDRSDLAQRPAIGFRLLAEPYWPNQYLLSRLVEPAAGDYLGGSVGPLNTVACSTSNKNKRCSASALDIVALVKNPKSASYLENSNYKNYSAALEKLKQELESVKPWNSNAFWSSLEFSKQVGAPFGNFMPAYAKSPGYQDRLDRTAASAWVNWQLPSDKFSTVQLYKGNSLGSASDWSQYSYIEPDLELINELIAKNSMVIKMLSALRLNEDVASAVTILQNVNNSLNDLKAVVLKELAGEQLTSSDNAIIIDFTKQWKIEASGKKSLSLPINKKGGLKIDLSRPNLMIVVHQDHEGNNIFAVGPVWNPIENR